MNKNQALAEIRDTMATDLAPELKKALPAHVTPDKFSRVAMTAIVQNPDLLQADRQSLFSSVVKLAQDGLLPNGREAALVIFNTKVGNNWVKSVQAMPMIAGVLKQIRNSGEVAKVNAQVVYENDFFEQELGFDEQITHRPPPLGQDRGAAIGAYAVAVLKSGEHLVEVMDHEQIEQVRSVSKTGQRGPWAQWWGEMARKTVLRRLSKRLPMSSDVERLILEDATTQADFGDDQPERLSGDMLRKQAAGQPAIEDRSSPEPEPTGTRAEIDSDEPEGFVEEAIRDQEAADPMADNGYEDFDDEIPDFDGPPPHGDEPAPKPAKKPEPKKPLSKEMIEEGCAAADEGEDEPTEAERFLDSIQGRIKRAKTAAAIKKIDGDWLKNRAVYDDDTAAEIDKLINAKRKALS